MKNMAPCDDGHTPHKDDAVTHAAKPSSGYGSPNQEDSKRVPPKPPARKAEK